MYDVAVIGAGIVGACTVYELSKLDLDVCLIEMENDAAAGATKANSALVHAGFDPEEGTLMARFNVEGCSMFEELSKEAGFPYKRNGALVLAFSEDDLDTIGMLYKRGIANGVEGLRIIGREELLMLEPNVGASAEGALLAQSAGIVGPWEMCMALIGKAAHSGVSLRFRNKVTGIRKTADFFEIEINGGESEVKAKRIVNAAGIHADEIMEMAGEKEFEILPRKGQYYVLDKSQGTLVSHTLFQCPSDKGKGVMVTPTVHGNLLVGPDSGMAEDKEDKATSRAGLEVVKESALRSVGSICFRDTIRNYAGLRAYSDRKDFIIEESASAKGLINLAGIKSPGLTAAPAIAREALRLLEATGMHMSPRQMKNEPEVRAKFGEMSDEDKQALIQENPAYGRVICRCEGITEGEIIESLKGPLGAVSLDGVKRRVRPGSGRCQGGFCGPKVIEIISRELMIKPWEVPLDLDGSYVLGGEQYDGL